MDNNPVVTIELDRVRELRFGHKAMKRWSAYTGRSVDSLDTEAFRPDDIEPLMYFMMEKDAIDHGEQLKMEDMENLLDMVPLGVLYAKFKEAMEAAFPPADVGTTKNANRSAGIGKKA